ncbi:MAG: electron transfer flavoprotein subunit alpha [Peptococcaceae bacterium]|nr:electron transfer flavoprotein subunit alpha [Peptococcaceae bacterium]
MKSVAVFKWAVNPQDARVNADGAVDWSTASPWVGDDDYVAAQVACKAAGPDGEVVGLTLAGGDVAFAAARGAQHTVAIDGLPLTADALAIAQALAAAVRSLGIVDVVAIGDSAWEPSVPVMLAGLLGWTALMAVDSVEIKDDGLCVTRRFGTGTQDVNVRGPVVLGVTARREEENKPGMRAVLNARKKPVTTVTVAELVDEGLPSFTSRGTHLPETAPSRLFDGSDPNHAVSQLLQALQAEGAL